VNLGHPSSVDEDLAGISPVEIANAYRAICAAMLIRTAQAMRGKSLRQDEIDQRKTAAGWVSQGGVITFDNCCMALEINSDTAKTAIFQYARGEDGEAIKKVRTRSRLVSPRRKKSNGRSGGKSKVRD
jgi:hypothetical protein